jgi:transposase-like protein
MLAHLLPCKLPVPNRPCGVVSWEEQLRGTQDGAAERGGLADDRGAVWAPGVNVSQLAERHGVSRAAIREQARRRGWVKGAPSETGAGPGHSATASLAWMEGQAGGRSADERERLALIRRHQRAWREVEGIREVAVKIVLDESFVPPGLTPPEDGGGLAWHKARLAYAKTLIGLYDVTVRATTGAQEGERRAHGFDYLKLKVEQVEDKQTTEARQKLLDELHDAMEAIVRRPGGLIIEADAAKDVAPDSEASGSGALH